MAVAMTAADHRHRPPSGVKGLAMRSTTTCAARPVCEEEQIKCVSHQETCATLGCIERVDSRQTRRCHIQLLGQLHRRAGQPPTVSHQVGPGTNTLSSHPQDQ